MTPSTSALEPDSAVPAAPLPPASPAPARRDPSVRRPFGLYVLAVLLVIKSGVILALVFGVRLSDDNPIRHALQVSPELAGFIQTMALATGVLVALSALLAGSAVGLVLLRRDGWLMAMVLTGLFVAADIVGFYSGQVSYLWMALNIATVFYLNQAEVRAAVDVSTDPLVPGASS